MSDERERESLITRMESAGEPRETESALEKARVWLRDHPGDDRVAIAMQRLEKRDERLRDPENAAGWRGIAAVTVLFCVVALGTFGAIYALSGRWTVSIIVGVVLGLEITWWSWEITMEYVRSGRSNRSGD